MFAPKLSSKSILLENEILFKFETELDVSYGSIFYLGIVNIIIEWDSYQEERFCELTFASTSHKGLDKVKTVVSIKKFRSKKFSYSVSTLYAFLKTCRTTIDRYSNGIRE